MKEDEDISDSMLNVIRQVLELPVSWSIAMLDGCGCSTTIETSDATVDSTLTSLDFNSQSPKDERNITNHFFPTDFSFWEVKRNPTDISGHTSPVNQIRVPSRMSQEATFGDGEMGAWPFVDAFPSTATDKNDNHQDVTTLNTKTELEQMRETVLADRDQQNILQLLIECPCPGLCQHQQQCQDCWIPFLKELTLKARQIQTHSMLVALMIAGLQSWFHGTTVPIEDYSTKYHDILKQQQEIGWGNLLRGRLAKGWNRIQNQHNKGNKKKQWVKEFVLILTHTGQEYEARLQEINQESSDECPASSFRPLVKLCELNQKLCELSTRDSSNLSNLSVPILRNQESPLPSVPLRSISFQPSFVEQDSPSFGGEADFWEYPSTRRQMAMEIIARNDSNINDDLTIESSFQAILFPSDPLPPNVSQAVYQDLEWEDSSHNHHYPHQQNIPRAANSTTTASSQDSSTYATSMDGFSLD